MAVVGIKNEQINKAHQYITDVKGLTAFSDAYFDELDRTFGFAKPAPVAEPEPVDHVGKRDEQ